MISVVSSRPNKACHLASGTPPKKKSLSLSLHKLRSCASTEVDQLSSGSYYIVPSSLCGSTASLKSLSEESPINLPSPVEAAHQNLLQLLGKERERTGS
jgi:hypothetical protein